MADSIVRFLEKTATLETELGRLPRRTVEVVALAVKGSVTAQMVTAGVQNSKLRGVGKEGTKIGVRYDFTGPASALVRATGPFHLIESDTKRHRTPKVRGSRARRRLIVIPGVGVRAFANVKGTKGKHLWEKGVAVALPIQEKAQGLALQAALRKAYG